MQKERFLRHLHRIATGAGMAGAGHAVRQCWTRCGGPFDGDGIMRRTGPLRIDDVILRPFGRDGAVVGRP